MPGIYHRVEKGQTLWRIAQVYQVDLDELARANHISDSSAIEVGQLIFIPGTKKSSPVSVSGSTEDFVWPVKGKVICGFNQVYRSMLNKGLNIRPTGASGVQVARSGRVVFYSPNFKGFGRTIIVDHGDGFSTVYANSSQVFIKPGDYVHKGDVIAKVSPQDGNGYLHFEVRKGYTPQNPIFYLSR